MSTFSQFFGSSGGGGGGGRYNACKIFSGHGFDGNANGTDSGHFSWTIPTNLDVTQPISIWVWGAGGAGGCNGGSGTAYGGGAGGLAFKEVTYAASDLGSSIDVTIGRGTHDYNNRGGSSSWGTVMSATGGNSGANSNNPTGDTAMTGESSNPHSGENAQGGIGVGGTLNFRGGRGGSGAVDPSSGYGGGGGSAPSPDCLKNGMAGGNGTSYAGGSGASINYRGTNAMTSYSGTGGAGTAGRGTAGWHAGSERAGGGSGGAGLNGAGGSGGTCGCYSNNAVGMTGGYDGQGFGIWAPNEIILGGGGGGGGAAVIQSSEKSLVSAGNGGPGAGGGGAPNYNSSSTLPNIGGCGGVLGGGGGVGQYSHGGAGGAAGGGGGSGYDPNQSTDSGIGQGGDGLIFIQYKLIY